VSYRGYGLSGGYPDEEKMKSDTLVNWFISILSHQTIIDYIIGRQDVNKKQIYLLGVSFGGANAIFGASMSSHKVSIYKFRDWRWLVSL
jgi:hypothetical protein